MRDDEILRGVGLGTLLDNVDNNFIGRRVLRAMAKARDDERDQARSDVRAGIINGDLPDACEAAADYVVNGFPKT